MNEALPIKIKSVLISMADRFGMEPAAFEQTLRATVVPANCSKEQFAAFLLVAKQYNLNPITKEIYAFPDRRGGIVPIVGVDGWLRIINEHPMINGLKTDENRDYDGNFESVTCTIHRKDRDFPTIITEYLSECVRDTEPWKKWPKRMLRHKATIQAARYAFGFSGIMEPDEFERGQEGTKSAYKARQDGDWQVLMTQLNEIKTYPDLVEWCASNKIRVDALPLNWREHFDDEIERRSKEFHAKEEAAKGVIKKRGRPPKIKEQLKESVEIERAREPTVVTVKSEDVIAVSSFDSAKYMDDLEGQLAGANQIEIIEEIWDNYCHDMHRLDVDQKERASKMFDLAQIRVEDQGEASPGNG